ncbi:MAG: hypothetical protein ACJASJ_000107 [Candidatus Azotimanducaceae bacterium]|jgi:hypothetical protein|tara:strand:- start:26209 stop:26424 length:216 start_codon:yes stop_codon:yes gene_type:complete
MTTQLQPAIEFAMMGQQTVFMGPVYNPGRPGNMTHRERPLKAIFVAANEGLEGLNCIDFFGIPTAVPINQL